MSRSLLSLVVPLIIAVGTGARPTARAMHRLEADLGATLLDRMAKRMAATTADAGR